MKTPNLIRMVGPRPAWAFERPPFFERLQLAWLVLTGAADVIDWDTVQTDKESA